MAKKGILEHPKTLTLADSLGLMDCCAVGILETFWHHVGKYHDDGDITNLKPSILARSIRYTADPQQLWDALIEAGFIDVLENGKTVVHDWSHHCEDSIHSRLFRAIRCFADGTKPLPKNLGKDEKAELERAWDSRGDLESTAGDLKSPYHSHSPTNTLPIPKPKPSPPKSPKGTDGASEFFEKVKAEYPKRDGDLCWSKAKPKIESIPIKEREPCLAGIIAYRNHLEAKGKLGTEYVKQAPTFFNQESWREDWSVKSNQNGRKELYHE